MTKKVQIFLLFLSIEFKVAWIVIGKNISMTIHPTAHCALHIVHSSDSTDFWRKAWETKVFLILARAIASADYFAMAIASAETCAYFLSQANCNSSLFQFSRAYWLLRLITYHLELNWTLGLTDVRETNLRCTDFFQWRNGLFIYEGAGGWPAL